MIGHVTMHCSTVPWAGASALVPSAVADIPCGDCNPITSGTKCSTSKLDVALVTEMLWRVVGSPQLELLLAFCGSIALNSPGHSGKPKFEPKGLRGKENGGD